MLKVVCIQILMSTGAVESDLKRHSAQPGHNEFIDVTKQI